MITMLELDRGGEYHISKISVKRRVTMILRTTGTLISKNWGRWKATRL